MLKILIAEDDRELRQLFSHVLMKNGYTVKGVSNGKEALEAMDNDYYDLIISDIMMPVMDGLEATRRIRTCTHPRGATVPIIAISANAFADDIQKAKNAGMNEHLAKPFEMEKVLRAISRYHKV